MSETGVESRRVALAALGRIDEDGAYANLVLPAMLDQGDPALSEQDRGLVTDLVYGTERMRRACDHLADRFLSSDPPPAARRALRLGTYQLAFRADLPAYAAVATTVSATPKRFRPLVNAVLRRVSTAPVEFPDAATRLSYPDWVLDRLRADLGDVDAEVALRTMNRPPPVHRRADGYVQDLASQWVADLVGALPGERVADLCAAPGGKATALAASGAVVVASDLQERRAGLVVANAARTGALGVLTVVADASVPPLRSASFDRVILDAPCSGLGVLRRRPDARWRIDAAAPERLAASASVMLDAAAGLLRVGGTLVYSVCTLTAAESLAVDARLASSHPELQPEPPPGDPWRPWGRGAILLPQVADTDGMCIFRYRRR